MRDGSVIWLGQEASFFHQVDPLIRLLECLHNMVADLHESMGFNRELGSRLYAFRDLVWEATYHRFSTLQ